MGPLLANPVTYICSHLEEITDPGNYNDYAITYHIM